MISYWNPKERDEFLDRVTRLFDETLVDPSKEKFEDPDFTPRTVHARLA